MPDFERLVRDQEFFYQKVKLVFDFFKNQYGTDWFKIQMQKKPPVTNEQEDECIFTEQDKQSKILSTNFFTFQTTC